MEKSGKKFIFRMFAEYCEIFYEKRVSIIYTNSQKQIINKRELKIELRKFIKSILGSDYRKPKRLVPGVNAAVESTTNKKIGTDFGSWILYNQGIDYGAPIPEDD